MKAFTSSRVRPSHLLASVLASGALALAGCGDGTTDSDAPGKSPAGNEDTATIPPAGKEPVSPREGQPAPKPAPIPRPEPELEAPAVVPDPATHEDMAKAIDLSKLPRLNVSHQYEEMPHHLRYLSETTVEEAREHYLKTLGEAGWKADDSVFVQNLAEYTTIAVTRGDYLLMGEFQPSNLAGEEGKLYIDIKNRGNVDPRLFPMPEGAKHPSDDRNDFSYVVNMDADAFVVFMDSSLVERGWKAVDESLNYQHGAMLLRVQLFKLGDREYSVSFNVTVKR